MALYYSNGEEYEAIYIPSGNPLFLETTGAYAGIRLDSTNAFVADVLSDLSLALGAAITPEDEPFPTTFIVGGIAI